MHIDGRRLLRKLAFNGIKDVVKAEMGGKWSRNEAFNAGMRISGEGFYCGSLDSETWENKLSSSWVNERKRGTHSWEELCLTGNLNEWRWMEFIHRLHEQHSSGGLDQPSIRPQKSVSHSTCWGRIFHSYFYFFMPVRSRHVCFFSFCREPWLTVLPCVVGDTLTVLMCLCANVSWFLDVPGRSRTWRPPRLKIWIDCVSLS